MLDRFDRDIDYLRISVTDKCNLRCTYCMPAEGVPAKRHSQMLTFEQITAIAETAVSLGITKIRLTGGEPLVRRGIVDLVAMLGQIPGLQKLAMTTNGVLLPRYAHELKAAGLGSVNISLDTLDPDRYRELTRGGRVEQAMEGVDAAVSAGFSPIKINTVVRENTTQDELLDLAAFCAEKGILLQRIREYRLAEAKQDSRQFERPPRCAECNRIRLTADGKFKACLHSDHEVDVDFADLEGSIRRVVAAKPQVGALCTNRPMISIGG